MQKLIAFDFFCLPLSNNMKYDFLAIGGVTEDITFYTQEGVLIENKKDLTKQKLLAFEYGAKIKIDKSFSGFGGGAANAAVCFSRLGFKAACLGSIGHDRRGQVILKNFKDQGVDASLMQKTDKAETGFSFLLVGPLSEHICFSNRAANSELKITNYELGILEQANWLYMTSMSGGWRDNLDKIFSVSVPKIAWNPGHRQILAGVKVIGKYFKRLDCLIVNKDEAIEWLRKKGLSAAAKKAGRLAQEGRIEAYIHPGSKIGVLVEVKSETDFVARSEDFCVFTKDVAMHIAACNPIYLKKENIPADILKKQPDHEMFIKETCLLAQPFVKDQSKTIQDYLNELIAKVGENIAINRFARYKAGEN